MHLALVRTVTRIDSEGDSYRRPELPASLDRPHAWGQASSLWRERGKTLVWVRGTSQELDLIAAQPGASVIGECMSGPESASITAAMRRQYPQWSRYLDRRTDFQRAPSSVSRARAKIALEAESHRFRRYHDSPRAEFLAAYRSLAETQESVLLAQQGRIRWIVAVLTTLGAAAGLALVHRILGDGGAQLAMAVLAADNFDRSAATLDGATMSDGSSTWALGSTNGFTGVSNIAQCESSGGSDEIEYSCLPWGQYSVATTLSSWLSTSAGCSQSHRMQKAVVRSIMTSPLHLPPRTDGRSPPCSRATACRHGR